MGYSFSSISGGTKITNASGTFSVVTNGQVKISVLRGRLSIYQQQGLGPLLNISTQEIDSINGASPAGTDDQILDQLMAVFPDALTAAGAITKVNNIGPDANNNVTLTAADVGAVASSSVGQAAGPAGPLGGDGKLPISQLPNLAANPSATVGMIAANGSANTFMRSDAAPAINQDINPVWTNIHTFTQNPILKSAVPGLELKDENDNTLGFITAVPGAVLDISTHPTLPISFSANDNRRLTLGVNGEFGLGNPVENGLAGQMLTSGGTGAAPTWTSTSAIVATDGRNAQEANINAPTFYAVPTSGMYRVSAFIAISQAATTSSTMPSCSVSYTEATTSIAVEDLITQTADTNAVGLHTGGSIIIYAQQGTNIGYVTSDYASSGTTPMQYAVQIKIEFLP